VKKIYAALVMVIVAAVALAVIAGCGGTTTTSTTGGSNPQTAVNFWLKGQATGNWDTFSSSILPDNLKQLPASSLDQMKQALASSKGKYSFSGITMKTDINTKDKTQALVTMTGGTISAPATTSTPAQNQKVSDLPLIERLIYCRQYKGHWYVDMAATQQAQQQQQQQQSTTPSSAPVTPPQ